MGTTTGRIAFSWVLTEDSIACRDCRATILMERWSSFFSMRILRAVSPNTCIRISVVGEAKNQCPNRAECLLFHMWMALLSFASLCCWWWVVGTCDFDVFGANDVGNNAQLADCDGNHPWLHFMERNDISNKISRTSMIFWRKSWKINDAPCEIYENLRFSLKNQSGNWFFKKNLWNILFFSVNYRKYCDFLWSIDEIHEISEGRKRKSLTRFHFERKNLQLSESWHWIISFYMLEALGACENQRNEYGKRKNAMEKSADQCKFCKSRCFTQGNRWNWRHSVAK